MPLLVAFFSMCIVNVKQRLYIFRYFCIWTDLSYKFLFSDFYL